MIVNGIPVMVLKESGKTLLLYKNTVNSFEKIKTFKEDFDKNGYFNTEPVTIGVAHLEGRPLPTIRYDADSHKVVMDCVELSIEEFLSFYQEVSELSEKSNQDILLSQALQVSDKKQLKKIQDSVDVEKAKRIPKSYEYYLYGFEVDLVEALTRSLVNEYGETIFKGTAQASGDAPPVIKEIKMPNGETVSIPTGKLSFPSFEKNENISFTYYAFQNYLKVNCYINDNSLQKIKRAIVGAQNLLNTSSIYKNKVLEVYADENNCVKEKYIDIAPLKDNPIWVSYSLEEKMLPLKQRICMSLDDYKTHSISPKYSVMFSSQLGGTGKTITIFHNIIPLAVENEFTVFYCKANDFVRVLPVITVYANRGYKCLLVIEDIDTIISGELRDDKINDVLNQFDSGVAKHLPIISLFTTNNQGIINSFFIRRLSKLIQLEPLTEEEVKSFIEFTFTDYLDEATNYSAAYKNLAGKVTSFVATIMNEAILIDPTSTVSVESIVKILDTYKDQILLSSKPTEVIVETAEDDFDKVTNAIQVIKDLFEGKFNLKKKGYTSVRSKKPAADLEKFMHDMEQIEVDW